MVTSEVLMVTPAVANLIATAKSNQISSAMESAAALGMQTLEQDLARLWVTGRISEATAVAMARNPGMLRDRAARMRARPAAGTANHKGIVMNETVKPAADGELLDMDTVRIDPAWAVRVPASLALRRQVLAFASVGGRCTWPAWTWPISGTLEAVERQRAVPICAGRPSRPRCGGR